MYDKIPSLLYNGLAQLEGVSYDACYASYNIPCQSSLLGAGAEEAEGWRKDNGVY